ncbi:MAG: hypothetical protein QOH46_2712 [Solirubrobacteraceae bacterium]|nr:hypothetical protein [Solirubrobacteraceae bacterium]
MAMGAALLVAPGIAGSIWAGPLAGDERARVLARALGARDLALGVAALLALREGDGTWAKRSFAAQAWADAVDFLAIAAAGDKLPRMSVLGGGFMAASSAAVAAGYARRLDRGAAATPPLR